MELESIEFLSGDARRAGPTAPTNIGTSIAIINAEAQNSLLLLDFEYTVTYSPDGSHIRLRGKARFNTKDAKKAQADWMKAGKFSGETGEMILNAIHYNASANAVLISKAFNLTAPLVLPTLKVGKA